MTAARTANHTSSGDAPPGPFAKFVRIVVKLGASTLLILLSIEASIRLVYYVRNARVEYVLIPYVNRPSGPVPPWLDALRITDPDDALIFKGRPNVHRRYLDVFRPTHMEEDQIEFVRRFSPSVPGWLKANPVWEVTHNSEGFRDREFIASKAPSSFRIVCLGDSWTWGNNVNEAQSYPQRLAALLREAFPNRQIEVLNLGVPGYSSYQGLKLLQDRALSLHPDVVLIGFAMNDAVVAGWRDKDAPLRQNSDLKPILENYFQSGKLLRYLMDVSRFQPIPMSDHLRAMTDADKMISSEGWAAPETLDAVAYERYESKTRVSAMDYGSNIREMIRLIRNNGGTAIMLYNELARGNQYQLALQKISKETGAPFVDGSALIAEARQQIEREIEQRLGLQAQRDGPKGAQPEEVEVVFRVFMGEYPVSKAVYVVGPHPLLGDAVPNSVAI